MLPIHSRLDPAHHRTYAAFAAGDGLAALLSVARAILEGEPHSRLLLFCGHRDSASLSELEALQALKDRHLPRLALHFVLSDEPQESDLFNGQLDGGKVRAWAQAAVFDPARVDEYYLCGPEVLNHEVADALKSLGVENVHLHGEQTGAHPAPREGVAEAVGAGQTRVTIIVDGRRRSFTMSTASGGTVLDAAEEAGLDLPFSCRAAVCSTCRTKVVKGAVDMEQNYALEPWEVEEGYVLACQSRPTTPELELDYDEK
jgi:ring-1,2-phenylacetyl-CoA epoxidase subunit PaaE